MPIQMQALISDSIYSFTPSDSRKRYKIHLGSQMEKFHQKVLEDEGVANLELSVELLANLAAENVRKKKGKSKFQKSKAHSQYQNESTSNVSSMQKLSLESQKHLSTLEPDVIMEKSECESNTGSSVRQSPKNATEGGSQKVIDSLEKAPDVSRPSTKQLGKGFVKKDGQFYIEEAKIDNSSIMQSVDSNKNMNFIPDMQDVEEVLFDIQNNYVNLDKKVEDQILKFTRNIENKMNELNKAVEFSNNQMNLYMQMMNQDIEGIKGKK